MKPQLNIIKHHSSTDYDARPHINKHCRIYVFPSGNTDSLSNRQYVNMLRKQCVPQIKTLYNISDDAKILWNRKAGCSCGCSPGFIILNQDKLLNQEIFVDIEVK